MADRNRQRNLVQRVACGMGRLCGDIPGACILLQIAAAIALVGLLGYLFITHELLG